MMGRELWDGEGDGAATARLMVLPRLRYSIVAEEQRGIRQGLQLAFTMSPMCACLLVHACLICMDLAHRFVT